MNYYFLNQNFNIFSSLNRRIILQQKLIQMEAFPLINNSKKIKFDPLLQDKLSNSLQNSKSLKNINSNCFVDSSNYAYCGINKNQRKISKTFKLIQQQSSKDDIFQNLMKKIQKVKTQHQVDHNNISSNNLSFSNKNRRIQKINQIQRTLKKAKTQVKLLNFYNWNKENKFQEQTIKLFKNQQTENKLNCVNFKQQNENSIKKQNNNIEKKYLTINFDYEILDKAQVRLSINIDQNILKDLQRSNQQLQLQQNQKIYQKSQCEKKRQISISDFQMGKSIGSGKFGEVFICKHKPTNMIFALKKIFKSTISEYKMVDQFINQLKINYLFDHPNIVKMYGHFHDQYHVFIIMEYAPNGSVIDYLHLKKGQKYASQVLYQTLNAIQTVHRKNVVHRDIKPQNIVVFFNNTYKICDFGLSTIIKNQMKHTFCGTADYVSPQMKQVGEYSFSVDIWSLGILAFQLITGYAPFKEKISQWKKSGWKKNNFWKWNVQYPENLSKQSVCFMKSVLKEKPQQRFSILECKKSQFIQKNNKLQMQIQKQAQSTIQSV